LATEPYTASPSPLTAASPPYGSELPRVLTVPGDHSPTPASNLRISKRAELRISRWQLELPSVLTDALDQEHEGIDQGSDPVTEPRMQTPSHTGSDSMVRSLNCHASSATIGAPLLPALN